MPATSLLLLLVATFIQGVAGLPAVLVWLQFGRALSKLSDQALYQARQRLGWRPLWFLRRRLAWTALPSHDPTAFYRGRRLVGIDGTTLTVADTPANVATFGKSRNQHNTSGFPLLRLVALCELGTRSIVRWLARPYRTSEVHMTRQLLRHVPSDALLIGDRNFHSYERWEQAKKRGFALLLRVQSGGKLPVLQRDKDGSYRSRIRPRRGRNKDARALPVRVIRAFVTLHGVTTEYRVVTNLLDSHEARRRSCSGCMPSVGNEKRPSRNSTVNGAVG